MYSLYGAVEETVLEIGMCVTCRLSCMDSFATIRTQFVRVLPPDMSLFGFGLTEHEPSDLRGGESAVSEPGTSCFSQLICEYLCGEACSLQEPAGRSPKFQIKKKLSSDGWLLKSIRYIFFC